ncbi:putative nuclear pore complex protein [Thermochaetoides thermophila DSM 1495]|uniref:Nucleoporin NUP133 n=1 Tax=Chaetomium thermophilum (strain DSM 1495 / CBS 144.50 / IMI 039719) TaxID=759272 RepID=NU133_CHATD|nr:putative nuclear pore complex protein [Thermochaetoides thermophila DSM 1495]G0S9A7.1 RecName: Full=Nucleoporin NUP133; AltName: Full=Nuclear pore protein NUP133 [Thermochaetoides thermophila DSM 1495]EGS20018.1 putative nuclear pore complex protein [Thermochaetoides thermophila DSM 1495]
MFSSTLHEDGPATRTRSSRRRQRPVASDSSLQTQPKAKRQRVPLTESNTAPTPTPADADAPPEMFEVKPDPVLAKRERDGIGIENIENLGPRRELSLRSKKPKSGERTSKGDGSIILTTNNAFTVSKLPALPDRLRAEPTSRQHGAIFSSGYALALTHTHAFVWPYTATTASPETFTFALPYPSKHASDPLPLGALVPPSASSDDPGLVVVMPVSGRVVYWESISSAATLDFIRQQRTGIEDAISGMYSSEHITQLVSAESAGFVLVFSSGRIAYMSVRDPHGRPGITVQYLRSPFGGASLGFLSTLRHALSGSSRGDIAAAHANHGPRVGERVVIAASSKGRLQAWKIHRGGHHEPVAEADVRERLVEAVNEADAKTQAFPSESFEVLDFAFVPRGLEPKYVNASRLSEALTHEEDSLQHMLLLVGFSRGHQARYSLVETVLAPEGARIGTVRPITSYTSPVRPGALEKPRLYLPRPALVAFVVFDRAVVVASMVAPPDSPDSQLQEDSHILPPTFEDVVDFRDDDTLQVVGSGSEEPGAGTSSEDVRPHRHKTKNPTAVLLLPGVGIVRVAITDIERFASDAPPRVTAKSKLEQAVFFGIKSDNPLVFQGRRALPFSDREVCDAAVELSHEIVNSKTPFIPSVPASLEGNMKSRSAYLDALITFLNACKVNMDERTRWMLLYDAEKMAVATWIWQKHEQFLAERPRADKKTLISEAAVFINENQKTELNVAAGQVDPVRHWFIHDIFRLDIFVAWAYQIIKYHYTQKLSDEPGLNRLVWEAVTINNGALLEARQFRLDKAAQYGVDPAVVPTGNGLPEPWTSTYFITNNLKRLTEFCHQWLAKHDAQPSADPRFDARLLDTVRERLPSLTSQYFTSLSEYITWAASSTDPETQDRCRAYQAAYAEDVYKKIVKLKEFDLWEEAVELAREFEAFDALADVVVGQILMLEAAAADPTTTESKAQENAALAQVKKQRLGRLMEEFGEGFASRAYEVLLDAAGVQAVLEFAFDRKGFITKWLRGKPELARISWVNEVLREGDVGGAAETLLGLGMSREVQVWNKKVELSLGKLALLAEGGGSDDEAGKGEVGGTIKKIDAELEVVKVQDLLYQWILASVHEAVDSSAEVELAVKQFGGLIPRRQKALLQIFEDGIARLLKHEVLDPLTLIDLLTLSSLGPGHYEGMGDQFFLALKVAHYAALENAEEVRRLIWRRCLVRDDWRQVNETNLKGDEEALEAVGETAAYRTLFACFDEESSTPTFRPHHTLKPSDCLGVYTEPEQLDSRFAAMDDSFRGKLVEAMRAEDRLLRGFVEKAQLDEWWRATRETAERMVGVAAQKGHRRVNSGSVGNGGVNGLSLNGRVKMY